RRRDPAAHRPSGLRRPRRCPSRHDAPLRVAADDPPPAGRPPARHAGNTMIMISAAPGVDRGAHPTGRTASRQYHLPMTRLSHLFVHVSDLEQARRFYVEDLGLSILMEEDGYLRLGGGDGFHMGMEQRDPGEVGSTGIEIVIQVPDVDVAYQN